MPTDWSQEEIASWSAIAEEVDTWKNEGKVVVFATGVFDLFHTEHQLFLQKARAAGDVLIVGVETDERVRRMKGSGRPYHSEITRLSQVSDHPAVDKALLLPKNFDRPEHHRGIIALLRPSILAVSRHSDHQDKKRAILEEFGGKLEVVHEHNPSVSTTQLLAKRT